MEILHLPAHLKHLEEATMIQLVLLLVVSHVIFLVCFSQQHLLSYHACMQQVFFIIFVLLNYSCYHVLVHENNNVQFFSILLFLLVAFIFNLLTLLVSHFFITLSPHNRCNLG